MVKDSEDFAKVVGEVSDAGHRRRTAVSSSGILISDISPALRRHSEQAQARRGHRADPHGQGIQFFKLESRSEARPEPFDKVRDQITQRIYEQRMDLETTKFLDKLRTQAYIEWKDEGYR